MQVPIPSCCSRGTPRPAHTPNPEGGPHVQLQPSSTPGPPLLETSLLSLNQRAVAAVLRETDVRAAPVNKAGEGGDWVTPVKYRKINTRTVGILQVN